MPAGMVKQYEEKKMFLMRLSVSMVSLLCFVNLTAGKEIHRDCLECHKDKDSKELKMVVNELCLKCHPFSTRRDHPVNIKASVKPEKLPLDSEGKITCITCHEPHGKTKEDRLLRMQFNTLCRECHKML